MWRSNSQGYSLSLYSGIKMEQKGHKFNVYIDPNHTWIDTHYKYERCGIVFYYCNYELNLSMDANNYLDYNRILDGEGLNCDEIIMMNIL